MTLPDDPSGVRWKMKVRAKQDLRYGDDRLEKGEVYDLPGPTAEKAIEGVLAEKVEETGGETVWKELEEKLDEEPSAPGKGWLTADEVSEGDEIVITGTGRWDDAFGDDRNRDLVIPVECKGEEYDWRVNKTNLGRIADAFGTNTGGWVGEKIVVDEIVDYPNLGTRGFRVNPATGEE